MSTGPGQLRVFISYSRRDAAPFADELQAGLGVAGFDAFLDRHDIAGGEDWEARLASLIVASDTVVFVITPEAVASERCAWEVAKARALSKRIIPVVLIDVPEPNVPDTLKRLNYIYFTQGRSFARSLGELAQSLRIDLDWVREHTRLGEAAERWRERDRADVLLLRGSEAESAVTWLAAWKPGAPEPTDLHRAFITESHAAEQRRNSLERKQLEEMAAAQAAQKQTLERLSRRTTIGIGAAGGLTIGAAALAWWGNDAENRFKAQQQKVSLVEEREKAALAEAETRSVEAAIRKEALRTDVVGQVVTMASSQSYRDAPLPETATYTERLLEQLREPQQSLVGGLMRGHAAIIAQTRGQIRPSLTIDTNADVYLLQQPVVRRRHAFCVSTSGTPWSARNAGLWEDYLKRAGFSTTRLHDPSSEQLAASLQSKIFAQREPHRGYQDEGTANATIQKAGFQIVVRPPPTDTFVFFVYSGCGYLSNDKRWLALPDQGPQEGASTYTKAVSIERLLVRLRANGRLSVALFESDFPNSQLQFSDALYSLSVEEPE